MRVREAAAACVLLSASAAWAIDDSVLGRDDFEFAQALVDNGYRDLARRLLDVLQQKSGAATSAVFRKARLDIDQADASQIDDPIRRRDALVAVLNDKKRFVEEFKDAPAGVAVGDALPDLCIEFADAVADAVCPTYAAPPVDALRSDGDAVLQRAEQWLRQRIDAFRARISELNDDERIALLKRDYDHARTLYAHALIFERGSARRVGLCEQALEEFENVDLGCDWDDPPLWIYRAYVYSGLCLNEMGKVKDAVESFDRVISLRQSYGDADAKTGVYPISREARDVVELVCDAVLQKTLVLRDAKKLDAVVAAAKDYFATISAPFAAPSSMLLARTLGETQLELGDAKGAADTARRMIRVDWYTGLGSHWGRELLERAEK